MEVVFMVTKIKVHHAISFAMLSLFLFFALFTGCEKEVEKIVTRTVRDTVEVPVMLVTVDAINANPDSIAQGGSITLTATVTKDASVGDITLSWFADAGTLDKTQGDTVTWKSPDDEGTYKVSVHASDGTNIGTGSRLIGVGMYAATVEPYHVGYEACVCHSATQGTWAETGHADAWASLQESGHPASYCEPCHTVTDFPAIPGNAGYDDAPIEKFENVQCESCHGPASAHPANSGGGTINVNYDAESCGECHDGTHHPYLSEWKQSPHSFDPLTSSHGAGINGGCQGCHEGVGAAERLADEAGLSTFYGGAPYGSPPRDTTEIGLEPIACATCHDPHDEKNPGQVRTTANVPLVTANGESPVIDIGGTGKLCMHCHHARRGPESQIQDGYDHFGPHANPQADMLAGKSAYHAVAAVDFEWADPSHLKVQNSCKTCHLNMIEYGVVADSAVTGHEFLPKVEACASCHGVISSFRDIKALDDFDGNGVIEGVQDEVEGLMTILEDALVDSFAARGIIITGEELPDSLGSLTATSLLMREAGYNYVFVLDDKSLGIHNPDYCVQLLQQSILHLTGSLPSNSAIVRKDVQVTAVW
jgi:hypothetical protein